VLEMADVRGLQASQPRAALLIQPTMHLLLSLHSSSQPLLPTSSSMAPLPGATGRS
jgi:hypothetical protein